MSARNKRCARNDKVMNRYALNDIGYMFFLSVLFQHLIQKTHFGFVRTIHLFCLCVCSLGQLSTLWGLILRLSIFWHSWWCVSVRRQKETERAARHLHRFMTFADSPIQSKIIVVLLSFEKWFVAKCGISCISIMVSTNE